MKPNWQQIFKSALGLKRRSDLAYGIVFSEYCLAMAS